MNGIAGRARTPAVVGALACALAGCTEPAGPPRHAPEEAVAFSLMLVLPRAEVRTHVVRPDGATTPEAIRVPVGTTTATTSAVDAGGRGVTLRSPIRVEIRNTTPAAALSVRRVDIDFFELTATSTGTVTVDLCLYHVDHCDIEAKGVPVVIEE